VEDALTAHLAESMRSGAMSDQSAAIGRVAFGEHAVRIATIKFELHGQSSVAWTEDEFEIGRAGTRFLMRQASCIGGGTTEMARNVISERVLGMPRERTLDKDVPFRDVPRSSSGRS
jgi:alkylation response protein AidB-like acyl-CoA dehydrogenase